VTPPGGTAPQQLKLALLAEQAGCGGFLRLGGRVRGGCLLAAMAVRMTRVRLGTLLSPPPWRRP
jgi:alkanesulfonate monooxygenase SsuD/methylene tetrahydromethanopterin reductase-like flavin-dependent oxidoreductase (luciferase family)